MAELDLDALEELMKVTIFINNILFNHTITLYHYTTISFLSFFKLFILDLNIFYSKKRKQSTIRSNTEVKVVKTKSLDQGVIRRSLTNTRVIKTRRGSTLHLGPVKKKKNNLAKKKEKSRLKVKMIKNSLILLRSKKDYCISNWKKQVRSFSLFDTSLEK
jgi:hypothetical protein